MLQSQRSQIVQDYRQSSFQQNKSQPQLRYSNILNEDHDQIGKKQQRDNNIQQRLLDGLKQYSYENIDENHLSKSRKQNFSSSYNKNTQIRNENNQQFNKLVQQQRKYEYEQNSFEFEDDAIENQNNFPLSKGYKQTNMNIQKNNSLEELDNKDDFYSINLIEDDSNQPQDKYNNKQINPYHIKNNKKIITQTQNLNNQICRQDYSAKNNHFHISNDTYKFNNNHIQDNYQQALYQSEQKKANQNIFIERLLNQKNKNQHFKNNHHQIEQKEQEQHQSFNIQNLREQKETHTSLPKKFIIVRKKQLLNSITSHIKQQLQVESECVYEEKQKQFERKQKEIDLFEDDYFDINKQKKQTPHNEFEQEYQRQQRDNFNDRKTFKNNQFLNIVKNNQNPNIPSKRQEIFDKSNLNQKKTEKPILFEIEDDDPGFESDYTSNESNSKKQQKLNNGNNLKQKQSVKQCYDEVNCNTTKQLKLKQKEDERKERLKQESLEKAKLERERKLEEESKLQRQKLAQFKKQNLQKQKLKLQKQNPQITEFKQQLKSFNFDENFAKSNTKRLLLLDDINKTQNITTNEQVNNEESTKNIIDINCEERTFDYMFDEIENEEEKKNYFSLIRFIFSQDYNKEDISRVENKRIPYKFSSWKEYFTIFEYLFLMECISIVQQAFLQYKQNENYKTPFNSFIKLINSKDNIHGFYEFQVFRNAGQGSEITPSSEIEAGELQSFEDDYYQLSTLKNNVVLITNESEPDLQLLSSTNFRKKSSFLFFGWVVPPDNDKTGILKIYVDIDVDSFRRQFQSHDQRIPVKIFNFQKMTTQISISLNQLIREYLAIKNMRYNDLNRFIYNPQRIIESKIPISNPQCMLPLFEELKQKYNKFVQSVKEFACYKDLYNLKKILQIIEPGTGKTHTLLGLLSGLYFYIKKNPDTTKPKIMICAPSNTAIDEIISRIIEVGLHAPGGQKIQVKVIRIGAIDYVPSENVKQACLEYQIEKKMKEIGIDQSRKVECETIIDMQIEVAKINLEIAQCKKELNGEDLKNQLNVLLEKKRRLQSKISIKKLEKVARRDQIKNISDQLLGLADVVCCTLASSVSEKLERFKNQVEVLIVDEAAQCTEPNNIIPLFYQPNKMVLIGDPKQLPATTFQPESNITKYNRSLFERIIDNKIKPYFLDQQYRMHHLIREFPSQMFYDNKLKDGQLIINRPFPNYLKQFENKNIQFIDLTFSKEKIMNKSYYNKAEGLASIHICSSIIDEIENLKKLQPEKQENLSIGIITPYKQQTKFINDYIKQTIPKIYHKCIQVNTVDSFQGQEKDIIILTTVRVNSKDEWRENMIGFLQDERRMNVAITRARFCLIVLGHADTLNSNPMWGSFVDFMANKGFYGKLEDKKNLPEVGNMILKGQLLNEKSANYVKKDWGEEYKAMLLKNNQVNELKLTDFETIQIEEVMPNEEVQQDGLKQMKETSTNRSFDQIKQDQQIFKITDDDNYDKSILVLSGSKEQTSFYQKGLQIIEEPLDFYQQKQKRTGISYNEAKETEEENMQIKYLKGGLEGLNALIDQPRDKKTTSRSISGQKSDTFVLEQQYNLFKKDDNYAKQKKSVSNQKENNIEVIIDHQPIKYNLDINKITGEKNKENFIKQNMEQIEKIPSSPNIQIIEKIPSSPNIQIIENSQEKDNQYKKKQDQDALILLNSENSVQKSSSLNQKQDFSLFQAITQTTLIKPKPQSFQQSRGLSSLISQDTKSQPIQIIENKNPSYSIYDQVNKQRQQSKLDKKKNDSQIIALYP